MKETQAKSEDQRPARESNQLDKQPASTDQSRNVVNSQPVDDDELTDNLAAADSSLEKPVGQEK